ncbi:hydroxymyristoyl-ACP dehydratase [Bacteroides acidifaciens]|uniref:hydroxymyristoyl-ACP dehydratase n=1 Tax=Bacteroides acidifaciens TaxID=85831 RepID=UPI0025582308|nr:hydroxymyristoyl-ACP dehydratase [Bacteroides acidifaciens]
MILKNNLYKISASNIEEKSFNLELVPDCVIYQAHFPEQPITPGVCIIQIASELLNELLQTEYKLTTVSNAKFLAVINPLDAAFVTYTFNKLVFDEDTKTVKASVVVGNTDTVFTKLSLVYKKQ